MADIELIVKIPRKVYKAICDKNALGCDIGDIKNIIRNGTPLPKGHGRLIDGDKLLDSDGIIADSRKCHYIPMIDVYQALTIIEADREQADGNDD